MMHIFDLPAEIIREIFLYDSTFHEIYRIVLRQLIARAWNDGTLPDSFADVTPDELNAAYSSMGMGFGRI